MESETRESREAERNGRRAAGGLAGPMLGREKWRGLRMDSLRGAVRGGG